MSNSNMTTDHEEIRNWATARGGRPARVRDDAPGGILRLDFAEPEDGLEEISWDEFFRIFEDRKLAFVYQDQTGSGETSRFNKFVER